MKHNIKNLLCILTLLSPVPIYAEFFLKPTSFPGTSQDLSFTDRYALAEAGYKPFEGLTSYEILNIMYTDQGINDQLLEDEALAEEEPEDISDDNNYVYTDFFSNYDNEMYDTPPQSYINIPNYGNYGFTNNGAGYCRQTAPHIPQNQSIPIGKPVLESDYKYCSGYGVRKMKTATGWQNDNHYGFDIGCSLAHFDKPVFTPADGIVERVQPNRRGSSAGNYIVINHQNGFKTYYMHLNTMLVKRGQNVSAGCQIATIGHTGGAKINKESFANVNYPTMGQRASHLHYQIYYTGPLTSVTGPNGRTIPIVHKFGGHQSIDPAYFMGVK